MTVMLNDLDCPNQPPCSHLGALHRVDSWDDLYPACSVDGCRCGHPSTALVLRRADGTVTCERADRLVELTTDALRWYRWRGGTLSLDTAGQHRYRYLRRQGSALHVFERVTDES